MKLCPICSESYVDDAAFCPIDGTALVKNTDPLIGRTLASRYRLVKRLGSGATALVYLARHVMIERLSAIKVLRQDLGMNPQQRERFLREARAVNRINHPGIIEITDFGESDGLVFLVMEYVEGASLLATLRQGAFPWQRAARVAMQVASALARAHELGVIHRDLKPENVLLIPAPGAGGIAGEERVKLTDFGIAKVLDAPRLTFNEQRLGTPGYIAPEYMDGKAAGPRGDLYSLGVVLYEMLTGRLPFEGKGVKLLLSAMTDAPIPPSQRVSGIPPDMEELVLRLIARSADDRPRGAFLVHDLLAEMLERHEGEAETPGTGEKEDVAKAERESMPTMVDEPPDGPSSGSIDVEFEEPVSSEGSSTSKQLLAVRSGEIVARWRQMMSALTQRIEEREGRGGGALRRPRELAEVARELMESLDRARAMVSEHQAEVDRLEAHGRGFRATLGHAIDTLSRDLSQETAHLDAILARREGLDATATARDLDARRKETLFWEDAALATEEKRVRSVAADLTYQMTALQKQLDAQNEELEAHLTDATGKLEGALTALRRIQKEFVRTIEDANGAL
jgi:serine/threonine-protein kinase